MVVSKIGIFFQDKYRVIVTFFLNLGTFFKNYFGKLDTYLNQHIGVRTSF
jgi:hypothetical protein